MPATLRSPVYQPPCGPPPPLDDAILLRTLEEHFLFDKPQQQRRRRRQRQPVKFNERCLIYSAMHYQEPSDQWFKQHELESFQLGKRNTIKAIKYAKGNLGLLNKMKYEIRGFEQYQSSEFNKALKKRRISVQRAVLEAQTKSGDNGDERLAQVSREQSQWAKDWALDLAAKDAKEVNLVEQEFFAMGDDDDSNNIIIETSSSSDEEDSTMSFDSAALLF